MTPATTFVLATILALTLFTASFMFLGFVGNGDISFQIRDINQDGDMLVMRIEQWIVSLVFATTPYFRTDTSELKKAL